MRRELIVCDACGKTWDRVQNGDVVYWDRQVQLTYKGTIGFESAEGDQIVAEVCDPCVHRALGILMWVTQWLRGDRDALRQLAEMLPDEAKKPA